MEWIKCSDRMPEAHQTVLAKDYNGLIHRSYATGFSLFDDRWWGYEGYSIEEKGGFVAIEWMPLPEKPKEK